MRAIQLVYGNDFEALIEGVPLLASFDQTRELFSGATIYALNDAFVYNVTLT